MQAARSMLQQSMKNAMGQCAPQLECFVWTHAKIPIETSNKYFSEGRRRRERRER